MKDRDIPIRGVSKCGKALVNPSPSQAGVLVTRYYLTYPRLSGYRYPRYLETYPTDAEYRESMNESCPPRGTGMHTLKDSDKSGKPRRLRKKKTVRANISEIKLWNFIKRFWNSFVSLQFVLEVLAVNTLF